MKCPIPREGKSSPTFQYTISSFFPPASFLKIFSATISSSAFEIVSPAFFDVSTVSGFEGSSVTFLLDNPNEIMENARILVRINNLHLFLFINLLLFLVKILN